MRKLPSLLARTLTSGTSGSSVLPDMSEGKKNWLYFGRFRNVSKEFILSGGGPSCVDMVWITDMPLTVSS